MTDKIIIGAFAALVVVAVAAVVWTWVCYQPCEFGQSLLITRKTGQPVPQGHYAVGDQKGILKQMRGPGRHFLNPWTYSVKRIKDVHILPGRIGTVKNSVGKLLPEGRLLAGADEKGTQRAVLTPGLWRINTFGQVVEVAPATIIKPGYVGVQKMQEGQKGVLPTVLQAGYYNVNPFERIVHQVEVGYRVLELSVEYTAGQQGQKIVEGTGVSFPLADGKQMHLDMTVVWGIFPADAPRIMGRYENVADVARKVIEPQVDSICKNAGSDLTTQEFIEGQTREEFQDQVTKSLQDIGETKGIHFLIALVRGFHPAPDIKATIQARMIAEEEKATLRFEQQRDSVAANLEEATLRVEVASKDFDAQTITLVEQEMELGRKKAAEIQAQADRVVAQHQRQTAEIDAQIVKILGQAEADVIEAKKTAEATRLQLLIAAYGGPDQYNLATFAESLPDDIKIEYRYAGEGTFWTDAKASLSDMAAKKILRGTKPPKPKPAPSKDQ